MKKFLHSLLGLLNINGKELPVFLLSILVAFSIWFIHNLSFRYNDSISVYVSARCDIEGHSATSVGSCNVVARGRTTGFNIMRLKMSKKGRHVEIYFSKLTPLDRDREMFYITTSELQEYTPQIFGDDVILEYYLSDTLFFRFPLETFRKVPVKFVRDLGFAKQYTLVGDIAVEPDSVIVYGEPDRLEKISGIYTEPVKLSNLHSDAKGMVKLEKLKDMRYSVESVKYSVPVVRYVEISSGADVVVENLPKGRNLMIFPSSVKILYKCKFPYKENVLKDIRCYVDYGDFSASRNGICVVRIAGSSQDVISWEIYPPVVECVLAER